MINWKGFEWMPRETWNEVHPQKPLWWYDETAIEIDSNDVLHLKTHYNPKRHIFIDKGVFYNFVSPVGAGLICSTDNFHFGYYRIVCKLPRGKMLFPAIWLTQQHVPQGEWGSEVDIMEAFTNQFGSYLNLDPFSLFSLQRIWTAINYPVNDKDRIWLGKQGQKLCSSKGRLIFEMEWLPDSIKIYCNGKLTRVVDGEHMKYFQGIAKFKINNGVRYSLKPRHYKQETDFEILDFIYKPKNKTK